MQTDIQNQDIINALNWRYATKVFDPSKKVSDENIHTILESGRLAPSSFGIEAWKFIVVKNTELREKIKTVGYMQGQITDASHLVVVARRTDAEALSGELMDRISKTRGTPLEELAGYKGMIDGRIASFANTDAKDGWIASQAYIALGTMIETAALLGVDAAPMEGFDPSQVDEILTLTEKNLKSTVLLAIGYRGEDSYALAPKTRRVFEEVVEVMG